MNNRYYSPAKFDSDQKDILISQLKAEIYQLRQNERDFSELSTHLQNLQHRYTILNEEKLRNEQDFQMRNENNLRIIANLRTELDTQKAELTERHIENQQYRAQSLANQEIAEHRGHDIFRFQSELNHMNELNARLSHQKGGLESENAYLKEEKRKILDELDLLSMNADNILNKNSQLEKLLREKEYEISQYEKQAAQLKSIIDQNEVEIENKNQNLRYTNIQLTEAQNQIGHLNNEVSEYQKLTQKLKNENQNLNRSNQNENNQNFELSTQILNLENNLKSREGLIEELKREINILQNSYGESLNMNEAMNAEIDILQRAKECLSVQNNQLIEELENFSEQDEKIRILLNRQNKVKDLKIKSDLLLRQTSNQVLQKNSPVKRQLKKSQIFN